MLTARRAWSRLMPRGMSSRTTLAREPDVRPALRKPWAARRARSDAVRPAVTMERAACRGLGRVSSSSACRVAACAWGWAAGLARPGADRRLPSTHRRPLPLAARLLAPGRRWLGSERPGGRSMVNCAAAVGCGGRRVAAAAGAAVPRDLPAGVRWPVGVSGACDRVEAVDLPSMPLPPRSMVDVAPSGRCSTYRLRRRSRPCRRPSLTASDPLAARRVAGGPSPVLCPRSPVPCPNRCPGRSLRRCPGSPPGPPPGSCRLTAPWPAPLPLDGPPCAAPCPAPRPLPPALPFEAPVPPHACTPTCVRRVADPRCPRRSRCGRHYRWRRRCRLPPCRRHHRDPRHHCRHSRRRWSAVPGAASPPPTPPPCSCRRLWSRRCPPSFLQPPRAPPPPRRHRRCRPCQHCLRPTAVATAAALPPPRATPTPAASRRPCRRHCRRRFHRFCRRRRYLRPLPPPAAAIAAAVIPPPPPPLPPPLPPPPAIATAIARLVREPRRRRESARNHGGHRAGPGPGKRQPRRTREAGGSVVGKS